MMVLTVVGTTSCGGDDDNDVSSTSQIVGTWRDIDTSDGNEHWTFNPHCSRPSAHPCYYV